MGDRPFSVLLKETKKATDRWRRRDIRFFPNKIIATKPTVKWGSALREVVYVNGAWGDVHAECVSLPLGVTDANGSTLTLSGDVGLILRLPGSGHVLCIASAERDVILAQLTSLARAPPPPGTIVIDEMSPMRRSRINMTPTIPLYETKASVERPPVPAWSPRRERLPPSQYTSPSAPYQGAPYSPETSAYMYPPAWTRDGTIPSHGVASLVANGVYPAPRAGMSSPRRAIL